MCLILTLYVNLYVYIYMYMYIFDSTNVKIQSSLCAQQAPDNMNTLTRYIMSTVMMNAIHHLSDHHDSHHEILFHIYINVM